MYYCIKVLLYRICMHVVLKRHTHRTENFPILFIRINSKYAWMCELSVYNATKYVDDTTFIKYHILWLDG